MVLSVKDILKRSHTGQLFLASHQLPLSQISKAKGIPFLTLKIRI